MCVCVCVCDLRIEKCVCVCVCVCVLMLSGLTVYKMGSDITSFHVPTVLTMNTISGKETKVQRH